MGSQDDSSLQVIRYHRGSLQLLDHRKLPLSTVYFEIRDTTKGWETIKEMVVRGALAIAIAAALSLVVEASKLDGFSRTPDDAASFLINKLEYLLSSRPTIVNLSDVATKLTEIVKKSVATATEAKQVIQAYIEAAEIMMEDDVASNKAIGSYGSSFIQNQLKDFKKLYVLTHCNTGSLATTGYGTALGVIRSLRAGEVLENAYCTKTRLFNQMYDSSKF